MENNQSVRDTVYRIVNALPAVLMALFAAAIFGIFAMPLISAQLLGAGSTVNLYDSLSEQSLSVSLYALIALGAIAIVIAAALCYATFSLTGKQKTVTIAGKEISLQGVLAFVACLVYLAILITSCIVIGIIDEQDMGLGVFSAGACPVMLIVLSALFAVATVAAQGIKFYFNKTNSAMAGQGALSREQEEERRKNFYATHSEPIPPVKGESDYKRKAALYKLRKRRYDRAQEGEPSAAAVWLYTNKTSSLVSLAVLAVVIIVIVAVVIPILSNIFRIGKVEQIEIGDSHERVEEILGKPYEAASTDYRWMYAEDDYIKVGEKLTENSKEQEAALLSGDMKKLNNLIADAEKLTKELTSMTYRYIEVGFTKQEDNFAVSYVLFDATRCDSAKGVEKSVEKYELNGKLDSDAYYYYDNTIGNNVKVFYGLVNSTESNAKPLSYQTYFTDGSFYKTAVSNLKTKINGSQSSFTWSDRYYSDYEAQSTVNLRYCLGSVSAEGVWSSEDALKQLTSFAIPDSVTSIGREAFSGCSNLQYNEYDNGLYLGNTTSPYVAFIKAKNTDITSCQIHTDTRVVAGDAFYGCSSLASITIPDSVISIGNYAFSGCSSLTSITIPNSVTSIGDEAFYNCSSLTSIEIPNSVTLIGSEAFESCSLLTIYCEAKAKPSGWDSDWNSSNRPVVWDCKF